MISTRGRYALRVMIDIAETGGGFIPLDSIAERQNISKKYLERILTVLTRGNLLEGMRGKGGGYRLRKSPEHYTVRRILSLTEGSLSPVSCLAHGAPPCERASACRTLSMWHGLDSLISKYLEQFTLADLIAGGQLGDDCVI